MRGPVLVAVLAAAGALALTAAAQTTAPKLTAPARPEATVARQTAPAEPATPRPPKPTPTPTPVPMVDGYIGVLDIEASMPALRDGAEAPPEAQAILGRLKEKAQLKTRLYLTKELARQEVLSTDSILPAGTILLHETGSRFYVIADPRDKTYIVMDAMGILSALEGGIGIENSEYSATVQHTADKKQMGDFACRRSVMTVKYASAIPFENEKIFVQQKNDIEIWHTSELVSSALLEHFFFKFQRDRTGTVQKVVAAELGFPMEMTMTVSQGAGARKAPGGTVRLTVSELRKEKKIESELFRLPPAGYTKRDRNPYFRDAAAPSAP